MIKKFFIACIFLFSAVASANAGVYLQWLEWQGCASNDECMVLKDVCGGWRPVNKRFQKEAQEKIDYDASRIECMPPQESDLVPTATCQNKTCTLPSESK